MKARITGIVIGLLAVLCLEWPRTGRLRANPEWTVTPWPEGEALFHQDRRWQGADNAFSVDLGKGRVLWLFSDTFVATSAACTRRESRMVRNSLGIESGYNPASARMAFYWKNAASGPSSFFPERGDSWSWPGDGVCVENSLLIFLMKVKATSQPGAFGFLEYGWDAVLVSNPGDAPSEWNIRPLICPQNPFGVIVGSAGVMEREGWVYAFSSLEPSAHDVYVIRWPSSSAGAGDLSAPQWWDPEIQGWRAQAELKTLPRPVFSEGATEFSVHFDQDKGQFLEFQTRGFGAATIALRQAPSLTGPWSPMADCYRPPEANLAGVFNYAAKAHPELTVSDADLVLSYATNTTDFARLVDDSSLYYPRLVKLSWTRR